MRAGVAAALTAASVTIAELQANPHPALARLRAQAPVIWVDALNGWLVTGRDIALQVMRDATLFTVDDPRFSTGQVIGPSMLSLDGAEHSRHRQPFAPAFRPAEVRSRFSTIIATEVDRLIAKVAAQGTAEVRTELAGPLSVAVMAAALGLRQTRADSMLVWYRALVAGVSQISAGQVPGAETAAALGELSAHIQATLQRGEPDSLLVSALLSGLNPAEVVSNAAVLMFGGIETTEAMITNAIYHVAGHPELWQELRHQPELLPAAISESLRLEPAAANVDRYATADVQLAGAAIARGDLIIVSLAGANRDPAIFTDPDRFDVHRTNVDLQLAFAQGPHFCLGVQLARMQTELMIAALLGNFAHLRLSDRTQSPGGLVFRKPAALTVRWD